MLLICLADGWAAMLCLLAANEPCTC
jgi:hypothetical protein